jgi:hypothetical protein
MALLESAIGGVAVTVIEQAINATGWAGDQIRGAYKNTQAKQKALAAAQNYVDRYEKRHCQVKVMPGLMKEPLPLEDIYTAVKLLDDESIRYFAAIDDLERIYREKGRRSFSAREAERLDGLEVANREPLMMVLGGPGIGKSTFLRKIGLETLKTAGQIRYERIPVLLELKEFRDDTVDLKQKIATEFEICGFPESAAFTEASLQQGKLLVLLDGLDEVPTRNLNRVIEHIEDFVDTYDQNVFVASCRIAAYRSNPGTCFQRFTDVTLAEFDDEQIEQFIRRWFRSELDQEAGTADKYWELLKKGENKATKELAQTPLLLTFLCLVYDRQQMLPTQRSTLYGKALDILLSEWAAQKRLEQNPIYEGFHPDLEKVLLAQIAYDSFEQDQLFFLKDNITRRISEFLADTLDAPKHLDGAAVLKAIEQQQGILVERAAGIYSFSHLTLQEYLVALHVSEERLEDNLVRNNITNERWHEVFLLISGLRGNKAIDLLIFIEKESVNKLKPYPNLLNLLKLAENFAVDHKEERLSNTERLAMRALSAISSNTLRVICSSSTCMSTDSFTDQVYEDLGLSLANSTVILSILVNCVVKIFPIKYDCKLVDTESKSANSEPLSRQTKGEFSALILSLLNMNSAAFHLAAAISDREFKYPLDKLSELIEEFPSVDQDSQEWMDWINKLEPLIGYLDACKDAKNFSEVEAQVFHEYLCITALILRCKDAAVRIPKQAWTNLEARLLTV